MKNVIRGLFKTHLFVKNLERSIDFYANVMGLEQFLYEEERKASLFWIGDKPKQSFLGIWEKPRDEIDLRHFAFECDWEWILNESVDFLKSHKIGFWNFLSDNSEKSMVFANIPAIAIYFSDPDGQYLEFIGKLPRKYRPEKGSLVLSYEEWLDSEKSDR